MKQSVQLFSIWKVQYKTFQFPCILQRIINRITYLFHMEKVLEIVQVGKKEIK